MRTARSMLAVGGLVMAAALVYGFTRGGGWAEVVELTAYPWFNVSLVDVYVGFGLFAGWIIYRERSLPRAAAWIVLIMTLGNLVSCIYALAALGGSGGDWRQFWLGAKSSPQS